MRIAYAVLLTAVLNCSATGQALEPRYGIGYAPPAGMYGDRQAIALTIHQYWDRAGDYRIVIRHLGGKADDLRVRAAPGLLLLSLRRTLSRFSPYSRMRQSSRVRRTVRIPPGTDPSRLKMAASDSGWEIIIPRRRP